MNKVILVGRLTRDPELRTIASGTSTTSFSVAVNRPFTNQDGTREADFINCVAWRKQAENIAKYCTKGSQVAVEGRIQTGSFDGADGQKHYTTDIVADNVTFLGSRNASAGDSSNYDAASFAQPMPSYEESQSIPTTDVSEDPFKDFGEEIALSDDDLPF